MNKIEWNNNDTKKPEMIINSSKLSKNWKCTTDMPETEDFKRYLIKFYIENYENIFGKKNDNITDNDYRINKHEIYNILSKYFKKKLEENDEELINIINIYKKNNELKSSLKDLQNSWWPFIKWVEELLMKTYDSEKTKLLEEEAEKKYNQLKPLITNVYNKIWDIITISDLSENRNLDRKISYIERFPQFMEKATIDAYNTVKNFPTVDKDIFWDMHTFLKNKRTNIVLSCFQHMFVQNGMHDYNILSDMDIFMECSRQIQNYLNDKILKYFTINEDSALIIQNVIKNKKMEIWSTLKLWLLVINQQNKKSWTREIEKLWNEIPTNLISDENNFKNEIINCLNEIYRSIPYNSMDYFTQTIKNREENPQESRDFALNLTLNNKYFEWDICTWMSEKIKEKLQKKWIKCDLVRFKATRTVNDDCSWDWHVWIIIVYKTLEDEKEKLVRVDPWLAISEPIYFQSKDPHWKLSKYPWLICEDNKNRRYCLFLTWLNNYTWQILWLEKVHDYNIEINWNNIKIYKRATWNSQNFEQLKYDEKWELKDNIGQTYRITYNMDVLNREFPYKMFVFWEKNWEKKESIYYISNKWTVAKCFDNQVKLELDLNHPIQNPQDTIERDYFKVAKNLSFVRYDKSWNKIASIIYPIRNRYKPIKLKWNGEQTDLYSVESWWINFDTKNNIIIRNVSDLKMLSQKKIKKLLKISDALKYRSPFLSKESIPENNIILDISRESRENLYNLIYSLLKISEKYENFVDRCCVSEIETKDDKIDFDYIDRLLDEWINVNWREQQYLDLLAIKSIKSKQYKNRFNCISLKSIKKIDKNTTKLILNSWIKDFCLWIEDLEEWVAEAIWNSQIRSLDLRDLKHINRDDAGKLINKQLSSLNLWIEELEEWVAEALWNSQIRSLDLRDLKHINRDDAGKLINKQLSSLNLWIEELEEWVAEALWNSQIRSLDLRDLKHINRDDAGKLINKQLSSLNLWIEELEEWVAEVLWNSQIKEIWLQWLKHISKENLNKLTKNWIKIYTNCHTAEN